MVHSNTKQPKHSFRWAALQYPNLINASCFSSSESAVSVSSHSARMSAQCWGAPIVPSVLKWSWTSPESGGMLWLLFHAILCPQALLYQSCVGLVVSVLTKPEIWDLRFWSEILTDNLYSCYTAKISHK